MTEIEKIKELEEEIINLKETIKSLQDDRYILKTSLDIINKCFKTHQAWKEETKNK